MKNIPRAYEGVNNIMLPCLATIDKIRKYYRK
jgi:hypothetical protein